MCDCGISCACVWKDEARESQNGLGRQERSYSQPAQRSSMTFTAAPAVRRYAAVSRRTVAVIKEERGRLLRYPATHAAAAANAMRESSVGQAETREGGRGGEGRHQVTFTKVERDSRLGVHARECAVLCRVLTY